MSSHRAERPALKGSTPIRALLFIHSLSVSSFCVTVARFWWLFILLLPMQAYIVRTSWFTVKTSTIAHMGVTRHTGAVDLMVCRARSASVTALWRQNAPSAIVWNEWLPAPFIPLDIIYSRCNVVPCYSLQTESESAGVGSAASAVCVFLRVIYQHDNSSTNQARVVHKLGTDPLALSRVTLLVERSKLTVTGTKCASVTFLACSDQSDYSTCVNSVWDTYVTVK